MEFSDNRVWLQVAKKHTCFSFRIALRGLLSVCRLLPCLLVVWFGMLFHFGYLAFYFFIFYFFLSPRTFVISAFLTKL